MPAINLHWAVLFIAVVAANPYVFNSSESRLALKLLKNYNKEMRPLGLGPKNKTVVKLTMNLLQIISVQEKTQEMATSLYMTHAWFDYRLTWNKTLYENIEVIRMPPDYIWTPRIVLENNKDGVFDVTFRCNLLINYTGSVEWLPPALYRSTCTINVALFPFDWQNCTMVFRSATYDRSEMEIVPSEDKIGIDANAFKPNGEWDLVRRPVRVHNSTTDLSYQDITFYFIIRRRPQFYVMNLIIPCILLSSLSCFVFYLPSISCEKMTLSISVLLGETVFLFLIAQRMPETSLAVPLIAGYLLFCMTLVIISVVCSVIVCNIHYRSNTTHNMPKWVIWVFMEQLAPWLRVERPALNEGDNVDENLSGRESSSFGLRAPTEKCRKKAPSERLFESQAVQMGFRKRHLPGEIGLTKVSSSEKQNGNWLGLFTIPTVQTIPKPLKSAVESISYIAKHKKMEDEISQSQDDWGYVALIVDRALLWFYMIVFTLGTMAFFLQTALADYPEKQT